ncbi:cytochrome P450 [Artemisia annua]|uniref:Cytochrome P450 n=1 Tax=Artemisia annua TaxID=35608 RepID=A0A2U1Q9K7_ARTAN|nr:cytochrome P450 [Artemisia annua]
MTTKVDQFRIKELWNNSPFCSAFKKSNGKSGGIIAIWDTSSFSSTDTIEGDCFLAIKGTWQSLETSCLMIIVYAPQSQAKKARLWSDLTNLILEHDNLTIVMGDFNEVRSSAERMGSVFDQNGALKFNEFIANTGLMDLPLGRKRFTRINKHGSKLSKLDRIMVSGHYIDKWPQANLNALTSEFSDHSPLLLSNCLLDYGPIPFKFYNSWMFHKDFKSVISTCCASIADIGPFNNKTVLLKRKLQSLKACLKNWRQAVRLAESASAVALRARLDQIDLLAESGPLSPNNIEIRANTIKDLMLGPNPPTRPSLPMDLEQTLKIPT